MLVDMKHVYRFYVASRVECKKSVAETSSSDEVRGTLFHQVLKNGSSFRSYLNYSMVLVHVYFTTHVCQHKIQILKLSSNKKFF